MNTYSVLLRACTIVAFVLCATWCYATTPVSAQDKSKAQLSEDEAKAANAVNSAPDAAAKVLAAEAFVKKHPNSSVRPRIANYVVAQIARVPDTTQRLALAERFQKAFTQDQEVNLIAPIMLDSYIEAKRLDDAFNLGASLLQKQPEDLRLLVQLTGIATEEAKRQQSKHIAAGQQYAQKAIGIIETNTKPAAVSEENWSRLKTGLPKLYQQLGILYFVAGNATESRTRFEKASTLDPSDPLNYVMIASILDDAYQQMARAYQQAPAGKQKEEMLKGATEQLDKTIDAYARAIALSRGRPEYQQLENQAMQNLTPYYKYRHNQSTEGLDQLIEKYRTAAKPQ